MRKEGLGKLSIIWIYSSVRNPVGFGPDPEPGSGSVFKIRPELDPVQIRIRSKTGSGSNVENVSSN
jgi:hypothetical protein